MGQSDSELAHDLKTLLPLDVQEKYGIGGEAYNELLSDFMAGKELPNITPPVEDGEETVNRKEEIVLPVEAAPVRTVGYRGQPYGETILIQRVDKEHTSRLLIPPSLKAKADTGYAVQVGKLCKFVEKGQLVLFDKFASAGGEISLVDEDGIEQDYLVLKEYDVLLSLERVKLE
jgi:co-chaperonin GroES (HSP10)